MGVELRMVGKRIHAKIPYDGGAGPIEAKQVPGARWSKTNKVWTYPLDVEICYALRKQFGTRLVISKELADWARVEIGKHNEQLKLRSASDAELSRVPLFAQKLARAMDNRKYQKVGARYIADGKGVLIGDHPGLGKTLETLAGVVEAEARIVLVFAKKKAAEAVWALEIQRWLGGLATVTLATGSLTKAQRDQKLAEFEKKAAWAETERETGIYKIHFLIANIEMCRIKKGADGAPNEVKFPPLFSNEWDAVVVDESHNALIGRHILSNSITQTRYGFMHLPIKEGGLRVALSGTPFRGKAEHAWGTLNWLDEDVFSSFWRWAEMYFDVTENGFGGKVIGDISDPEAYDRMMAPYLLRRTKAEVAKDLPPKQYAGTPLDPDDPETTVGVWLEMDPAQARHYEQIKKSGEAALESGDLTTIGHLSELGRLKQFSVCDWDPDPDGNLYPAKPSNKYDWLVEFIESRAAAGLKVVVASQYTRVINAFKTWLAADGIRTYTLTGQTKDREVAAIVAAFNSPSDEVPAILINTMAGGESITLDTCADDLVFLDETFIPDQQEQVEDRIHRVSRIHQVNIWYVRSLGTVEEDICRTTGVREGKVKARLDGSRGVEIFRKLMGADRVV